LVNYQSTYRNSFFWNIAHKFYIDEVSLEEVINELDKIDYLSDNKVANMNGILNNINRLFKNYKGYYSWPAKTYFLYEYELYLMNNQANQKIYPDNLFKKDEKDKVSIEHIYPQTDTNEYWVERFGNYTETEQKYLNGSLGNLLPLSLSINIKLQNYSFDEKKLGKDRTRGYLNGSHSEMKVAQNNEWTPNEILQRGLEMINFMEERYDFIVPNKADRERMLGLDFMISEDDENCDVTEPINHEVQTTTSKAVSYSEEDFERLSSNTNSNLISMYKELDSYILSLNDDIQRNSTKHYISYTNGKSFVEFHFWKESLFLTIMSGEYNDPEHKIQKLDDRYKWSNMNRLDIFENDDLEYIKNLLKQSYEKTLK
jgi:predicted transport protein